MYLQSGNGRIFLKKSDSCEPYSYGGCIAIESITHQLGDSTSLYCPSADEYNKFDVIATIDGAESRPTFSLSGYVPSKEHSLLYQYYLSRCTFDIQIHYGECFEPTNFGVFDKSIVLNGVKLNSYAINNLTTLGPDGRGATTESLDASAESFYIFHRPTIQTFSDATPNGPYVSITSYCSNSCIAESCSGSCATYLQLKEEFSDTTNSCPVLEVVSECDGTTESIELTALPQIGNIHTVFMSTDSQNLYITLQDNNSGTIQAFKYLLGRYDTPIAWDSITTTARVYAHYNFGGGIIFGDTGRNLYEFSNSIVMIETITEGIFSTSGLDDDTLLLGGIGDVFLYDSGIVTQYNIPDIVSGIYATHMFSETKWLAGSAQGLYLTCDGGTTWTQLIDGCVRYITFADDNVGYASVGTETGGLIYMTIDGGLTFSPLTSDIYSSAFLDGMQITGLTTCSSNPETIRAVGYNEVSSDFCSGFQNGSSTDISMTAY